MDADKVTAEIYTVFVEGIRRYRWVNVTLMILASFLVIVPLLEYGYTRHSQITMLSALTAGDSEHWLKEERNSLLQLVRTPDLLKDLETKHNLVETQLALQTANLRKLNTSNSHRTASGVRKLLVSGIQQSNALLSKIQSSESSLTKTYQQETVVIDGTRQPKPDRLLEYATDQYDNTMVLNTIRQAKMPDRTIPFVGLSVPNDDLLPVLSVILAILSAVSGLAARAVRQTVAELLDRNVDEPEGLRKLMRLQMMLSGSQGGPTDRIQHLIPFAAPLLAFLGWSWEFSITHINMLAGSVYSDTSGLIWRFGMSFACIAISFGTATLAVREFGLIDREIADSKRQQLELDRAAGFEVVDEPDPVR